MSYPICKWCGQSPQECSVNRECVDHGATHGEHEFVFSYTEPPAGVEAEPEPTESRSVSRRVAMQKKPEPEWEPFNEAGTMCPPDPELVDEVLAQEFKTQPEPAMPDEAPKTTGYCWKSHSELWRNLAPTWNGRCTRCGSQWETAERVDQCPTCCVPLAPPETEHAALPAYEGLLDAFIISCNSHAALLAENEALKGALTAMFNACACTQDWSNTRIGGSYVIADAALSIAAKNEASDGD